MSHAVLHLLIIETSRNYQITDVNRGICVGVEEGVGRGWERGWKGVKGGRRMWKHKINAVINFIL